MLWSATVFNHRCGGLGVHTRTGQPVRNPTGFTDPHIKNQGMAETCKRRPVEVSVDFALGRDQGATLGDAAMREWNAGGTGTARRRGDSGDHLRVHPRFSKRRQLFAASAENKRVTAFYTTDHFPLLGFANQQPVQICLGDAMCTSFFTDIKGGYAYWKQTSNALVNQMVV